MSVHERCLIVICLCFLCVVATSCMAVSYRLDSMDLDLSFLIQEQSNTPKTSPECNCTAIVVHEWNVNVTRPITTQLKQVNISDLKRFLKDNLVDEQEFREHYVCTEFANRLSRDLVLSGIDGCHATLYYGYGLNAHAIVAVNTTTGIVFVEPQSDELLSLKSIVSDYPNLMRVSSCFGVEKSET